MIKRCLKTVDYCFSRLVSSFIRERPSLLTFLFHGLFLNEQEIALNHVDPQQKITVEHFRQFVKYYRDQGYIFISPDHILKGLDNRQRYVLITFDDGYFNNSYAVPVLEEFKVPAVFFFSPNYIIQQKSFWWDVVYRERLRQGAVERQISAEQNSLKVKTADQIERYLIEQFGRDALKPRGPVDRPFSVDEFRTFALSPYVFIGNHTADHAILPNYSPQGIREQIINAQYDIYRIIGKIPNVISYPNGSYSNNVLKITRDLGLSLGITVEPKKNYLPFTSNAVDATQLGRFILVGDVAINLQCEVFRWEYSLYNSIKKCVRELKRKAAIRK